MKKLISLLTAMTAVVCLTAGCKSNSTGAESGKATKPSTSEDAISVVTTIFPEYDWVTQLTKGNDNVEVTMLLDNGVDLHSFQPTADDVIKIADCDMFIYVGGESDEWVEDALAESTNKEMVVINLMEVLGETVKAEELVEGMEGEEEAEEGEEGEEEVEYDEHVWLSLKNSKELVQAIADGLAKIDSENAALYQTNASAYVKELDALDREYENAVKEGTFDTILFGDRFPFRYLVDDYQLNYYAAFVGCSAETEASFETITFLAQKVDELGLNAVLQIESADGKIAQTIVDNTKDKNQEILTLDSMQATTSEDVENGATYLAIMKSNLEVLKQALIYD
ncbi:MAG: zinc ABC transporter substrate-binding protein [Lachnospiraceae bacterium]|nr:zinc ABC transporter substrate-binding protein [Lachnospiraceae bacterium]